MNQATGLKIETFRPSGRQVVLPLLGVFLAVVAYGAFINWRNGKPFAYTAQSLPVVAALFAAVIALVALVIQAIGISVYMGGIEGRNYWGRKVFVPWSEVTGVGEFHSGIRFALVRAQGFSSHIVTRPDVLKDPDFLRFVIQYAGKDSPLLAQKS